MTSTSSIESADPSDTSTLVWNTRRNRGWVYVDNITSIRPGCTVLDFYVEKYRHSDRQTWSRRLEAGQIHLDDGPCAADTPLLAGSSLEYHRLPWDEPSAPRDFSVLYQDHDLVAVEKPSGLQVLPAAQFLENTLLHVVKERLGADLAPVHRLGRGTSGLVLFARTDEARRGLSEDLSKGKMKKIYAALAQGVGLPGEFTVDQEIGAVGYPGMGTVHAAVDGGKKSISHIRVTESREQDSSTLVEVEIPTGRPHQIRIHLAVAGYPLVGEPFYQIGGHPPQTGPNQRVPRPGDLGYHLHAAQVVFDHPTRQQSMKIECPAPEILQPIKSATT